MKKVLITGQRGLAAAIADIFDQDQVKLISRSNGHDIAEWKNWINNFLDCDVFVNNAYSGFSQTEILVYLARHWQNDPSKIVINIGSTAIDYRRSSADDSSFWEYRLHKQSLDHAFKKLVKEVQCRLVMINPGPIDTEMIRHLSVRKMDPAVVARHIKKVIDDPLVKRIDIWK